MPSEQPSCCSVPSSVISSSNIKECYQSLIVIGITQGRGSFGHAVGPQWASKLAQSPGTRTITLEYGVEVTTISSNPPHQDPASQEPQLQETMPGQPTADDSCGPSNTWHVDGEARQWPVTVYLSNGKSYSADLVISAIGVEPNTGWLPQDIKRDANDGGVIVDRYLLPNIHIHPHMYTPTYMYAY